MALLRVVATVTLVGLAPGEPVWVDDADAQIARWLRGGQLRAIDPEPEVESLVTGLPEPEAKVEPAPRPKPRRPSPMVSETR